MMVSIVKRKTKQSIGLIVEHQGTSNLKENLLKGIYNLYSFEGRGRRRGDRFLCTEYLELTAFASPMSQ